MLNETKLNITQRDLLIRIDERVKSMDTRLKNVERILIPPSEHLSLLLATKEHDKRITGLERWQARVVGFGAAAGAVAAIILNFLQEIFFSKPNQL